MGVNMFISKHEKFFTIILFILCAIFFLNIGYAKTSDNTQFSRRYNEFDIIFDNEKVVDSLGVDQSKTYIKTSKDFKNIYINVGNLEYPGSNVVFSVDVVNKGTVDAKIESVIANGFENSESIKFRLLNQEDFQDKVLMHGEKLTVNFMIEWDENHSSLTEEILNFNIEINCVQAI